jgi:hypothetical protein
VIVIGLASGNVVIVRRRSLSPSGFDAASRLHWAFVFSAQMDHIDHKFGSVRCCDMSVVDLVLFVVATCLLLIRFCSLL